MNIAVVDMKHKRKKLTGRENGVIIDVDGIWPEPILMQTSIARRGK